ncbi:hypothetical protein [Maricaulis sp.]|uniref:hypothetical protein n=1 Tax=Maricaulis sp. TaxID=1486257 RepID=UPI003A8D65CB
MTRSLKSALVLMTAMLPLAACGGGTNEAGTDGIGNDSPGGSESGETIVAMEQDLGGIQSQTGANLDLPDGFPDDVAHYPGLNIYGANAIAGMGFSLAALADGTPDEVANFYSREMVALGWTEAANAPSGPGHMLRFEKGSRTFTVNLIPNGDTTTLSATALN